jgi:hemerythrin
MHRPLSWHEAFSVGHEALDDEHRQLMGLINNFCAALKENPARGRSVAVLRKLNAASEDHLWHEDVVLREIQSSVNGAAVEPPPRAYIRAVAAAAIEDHIAEHQRVRESLRVVAGKVRSASQLDELGIDIMAWFVDHAVKHDARIRAVFQAQVTFTAPT